MDHGYAAFLVCIRELIKYEFNINQKLAAMKRSTIVRNMFLMLFLVASLSFRGSFCQNSEIRPVDDVFRLMEIVTEKNSDPLWPGFDVLEIPLLVYDSVCTWAFNIEIMPEGFTSVAGHPGVWVYEGQHPAVRGNSVAMLGGIRVATSVLSSISRRTGERYSSDDLAGIIIHEQFHVFQKSRFPHWMQNDGLLLVYPPETEHTLFLRRMEKEAFKRAVVSENETAMCGWVMEAIKYREMRLNMIDPVFRQYEMELQRTEGLSDYIEKTARDVGPLDSSEITDGIAPAGIRDLGYVEGRWIAMLLDKISPEWKDLFENDGDLYLEDILRQAVGEPRCDVKNFTDAELDIYTHEAAYDLVKSGTKKALEAEQFKSLGGFSLEIDAISSPLAIRMFEPLAFEMLDDGSLYHKIIFSAANEAGNLRVIDQACVTWFDNMLGVERIVINGINELPGYIGDEKRFVLKNKNIDIDLGYTSMSIENSLIRIEL